MVVVFDDLHWADAASQALLAELTARQTQSRLLVVVTSRATGSPDSPRRLARLARLGAIRLELDGLTESDVQALQPPRGSRSTHGPLRERTGGNPFLLQETLAFAAESGASPLDVVPASVADVLGARMARLVPPGEEVLLVASVLGSVIDPAAVAQLAELDPAEVDDGARRGAGRGTAASRRRRGSSAFGTTWSARPPTAARGRTPVAAACARPLAAHSGGTSQPDPARGPCARRRTCPRRRGGALGDGRGDRGDRTARPRLGAALVASSSTRPTGTRAFPTTYAG